MQFGTNLSRAALAPTEVSQSQIHKSVKHSDWGVRRVVVHSTRMMLIVTNMGFRWKYESIKIPPWGRYFGIGLGSFVMWLWNVPSMMVVPRKRDRLLVPGAHEIQQRHSATSIFSYSCTGYLTFMPWVPRPAEMCKRRGASSLCGLYISSSVHQYYTETQRIVFICWQFADPFSDLSDSSTRKIWSCRAVYIYMYIRWPHWALFELEATSTGLPTRKASDWMIKCSL